MSVLRLEGLYLQKQMSCGDGMAWVRVEPADPGPAHTEQQHLQQDDQVEGAKRRATSLRFPDISLIQTEETYFERPAPFQPKNHSFSVHSRLLLVLQK